jgi:hypothetical protein
MSLGADGWVSVPFEAGSEVVVDGGELWRPAPDVVFFKLVFYSIRLHRAVVPFACLGFFMKKERTQRPPLQSLFANPQAFHYSGL